MHFPFKIWDLHNADFSTYYNRAILTAAGPWSSQYVCVSMFKTLAIKAVLRERLTYFTDGQNNLVNSQILNVYLVPERADKLIHIHLIVRPISKKKFQLKDLWRLFNKPVC